MPSALPSVALILKGYPRLSETFIAQEIQQLEQRGLKITLISLRHPTDAHIHPIHREIQAKVIYLPEYLHQEPWRVVRGLCAALWQPGIGRALKVWLKDLRRDCSRNRIRRFGQAVVLARELPPGIEHLYAHFIHTPASVTRYCALIRGLPWSASAHAKDIWTLPEWEIREKLASLDWISTCTEANTDFLKGLTREPDKVMLVYHGLDFKRFPPPHAPSRPLNRGDDPGNPVRLISVGRAVPKKGYDLLLRALARLPVDLHWQLTHIGGGEQLDSLRAQARSLGIGSAVRWCGALPQEQVLQHYRRSDLFVLPSRVLGDGDRDGLPNVLMEAQSQKLCCLSTRISGIPELIVEGETGLLVEQQNEAQLADALGRLIRAPELRRQLAEAGFQRVHSLFSAESGIDRLIDRFQRPAKGAGNP